MSRINISQMGILSNIVSSARRVLGNLGSIGATVATAAYNAGVNVYKNIIGRPKEAIEEPIQFDVIPQEYQDEFPEAMVDLEGSNVDKIDTIVESIKQHKVIGNFYNVIIYYEDGSTRTITITKNNKKNRIKELSELQRFFNDSDGEIFGSDQVEQVGKTIKSAIGFIIEDEKIHPALEGKLNNRKSGAFFKYIHKIDNEYVIKYLESLGIYNKEFISNQKSDSNKPLYSRCVVEAFRGVVDNDTFTKIQCAVKSDEFLKENIPKIVKIIKRPIKLLFINSDKIKYTVYPYKKSIDEDDDITTICLIDGHYFRYDKNTQITKFYIKNYSEIPKCSGAHKVNVIKKNGGVGFCRLDDNFLDSIHLVYYLMKSDLLIPLSLESIQSNPSFKISNELNEDLCVETNCTEFEVKEPKDIGKFYILDYETFTLQKNQYPYLCSIYTHDDKGQEVKASFHFLNSNKCNVKDTSNDNLIKMSYQVTDDMISYLYNDLNVRASTFKECITIFAHNLTFDIEQIIKHPNFSDIQPLINGGRFVGCRVKYESKGIKMYIAFKDSIRILPSACAKIPDMLGIEGVQKEAIFYELFNSDTVCKLDIIPREYINDIIEQHKINSSNVAKVIEKAKAFNENIKRGKYERNGVVDLMAYAEFYCEQDCRIVYQGLLRFNQIFKTIDSRMPNVWNFYSLPSIAQYYFYLQGCYTGCYQFSGLLSHYFNQFVVGGRCMMANNQRQHKKGKIQDFDAVALYPSAMRFFEGFLLGLPNIWHSEVGLEEVDYYFVRVEITKINKRRAFPTLSVERDGSNCDCEFYKRECKCTDKMRHAIGRDWTNNVVGKIIPLDKVGLEDAVKYHGIEYKIIDGYYFNDGFNKTINDSIYTIFKARLEAKRNGNEGLQATLKLLMNATYGKLIQKPATECTKIYIGHKKMTEYINRRYHYVKHVESIGRDSRDETTKYLVYEYQPLVESVSAPHLGCQILSYSKRIMNQVMCTAEDSGIELFYQDTDSLHMWESDINKLSKAYSESYGRELIGKEMGQFHCDFDVKGLDSKTTYSTEFIAFGKKCYIDICQDSEGECGFHCRMKGVCQDAIDDYLTKSKTCKDLRSLYISLYNGDEHEFDLLANNKCSFAKENGLQHITRDTFTRKISRVLVLEENE